MPTKQSQKKASGTRSAHQQPKLDDLSQAELQQLKQETLELIGQIKQRWTGLVRLDEEGRTGAMGKLLMQFRAPMQALFVLLMPSAGKESSVLKHFHVLGDRDGGKDPELFEPDVLTRRLDRVAAEQEIHAALKDLVRLFGDDILHTGTSLMDVGNAALDLAKVLADSNPALRAVFAPILDMLRAMTKPARKAAEEARQAAKAAPAKANGAAARADPAPATNGAATTGEPAK